MLEFARILLANKYRLIAYMRYDWKRCFIKHVLTHAEYGKGRWKQ